MGNKSSTFKMTRYQQTEDTYEKEAVSYENKIQSIVSSLKDELTVLNSVLVNNRKLITQRKNTLEKMESDLVMHVKENECLRQTNSTILRENSALVANQRDEIKALKEVISAQHKDLHELDKLQMKYDDLRKEIKTANQELEKTKTEYDDLLAKFRRQTIDFAAKRIQQKANSQEIKLLSNQVRYLQQERQQSTTSLAESILTSVESSSHLNRAWFPASGREAELPSGSCKLVDSELSLKTNSVMSLESAEPCNKTKGIDWKYLASYISLSETLQSIRADRRRFHQQVNQLQLQMESKDQRIHQLETYIERTAECHTSPTDPKKDIGASTG